MKEELQSIWEWQRSISRYSGICLEESHAKRRSGQSRYYPRFKSLPAECMSETLPFEPPSSVVFQKVPHQNFMFFSNRRRSSHMQTSQNFQYLTLRTKGVESKGDEKWNLKNDLIVWKGAEPFESCSEGKVGLCTLKEGIQVYRRHGFSP